MKIAVTATGPGLDDHVDARFGRCAYFLIIDSETLAFETIENPNIAAGGGAGIQSASLMAEKGVQVALTGNCGPNAFQVFGAAGIQVIVGVNGQVRDVVNKYKQGAFTSAPAPNVTSHFGMGGMGRGMGRGGGMGRGMGGGMGRGAGLQSMEQSSRPMSNISMGGQSDTRPRSLLAVVDVDTCTGCGVCVEYCPLNAIHINETALIDADHCTGCGHCIAECPQSALSLHKR